MTRNFYWYILLIIVGVCENLVQIGVVKGGKRGLNDCILQYFMDLVVFDSVWWTFYQFSVTSGLLPVHFRSFSPLPVHFWSIFGPFLVHFWSFLIHFRSLVHFRAINYS